jgi:hypothetical protein
LREHAPCGSGDTIPTESRTAFLEHFQRTCAYPRRLLDSNLAPDYQKISYISQLPNGEQVILGALDEVTPLSVTELQDRFGIRQMLAESNTTTFMASLLYYLGVLTLDGVNQDGELVLRIPNLVIEGLWLNGLFQPQNQTKPTKTQRKECAEQQKSGCDLLAAKEEKTNKPHDAGY